MKKEQKSYPKRYLRYIVILIMIVLIPYIVLLITETVSLLSLLGKECVELSYAILGIAFFLIIFYGLTWSYFIMIGFKTGLWKHTKCEK